MGVDPISGIRCVLMRAAGGEWNHSLRSYDKGLIVQDDPGPKFADCSLTKSFQKACAKSPRVLNALGRAMRFVALAGPFVGAVVHGWAAVRCACSIGIAAKDFEGTVEDTLNTAKDVPATTRLDDKTI